MLLSCLTFDRDLKPENILVGDDILGLLKIADFGLSMHALYTRRTFVGTIGYMAPEMTRNFEYDTRADIWSLCAICYELLVDDLKFPSKPYVSNVANELIAQMLAKETLHQLQLNDVLEHPWIQENVMRGMLRIML
ncbi:Protein kinase superfamily protein [Euphorbia peplus]|nr:Protein kinase superfamily protein [Euphorbia peplus]